MAEFAVAGRAEPADFDAGADIAVSARDVHATYRVYEDQRRSLRRFVSERFRPRPSRKIHALQGLSFDVRRGEAVGLIGPNGSGKSTLLRALAGLLPVTEGIILVRGQPALLGVGAVLQANLSGRRNIVLGALALGMSRSALQTQMGSIIEFSGLREFIDLPLKTYSSGMRARLQFAIATAVSPDILLIDEALAVGDQDFKRRSENKIAQLLSEAGTVFLVTHNLTVMQEICSRAIWLDRGKMMADGEPGEVAKVYRRSVEQGTQ